MANCPNSEIQLTPRHVSFLVEHLSGNASVWRSLGTALQFQKGDLDNIQACLPLLENSPYSFMQRLVEEWLEGKYPHTAPPTLANLLKALNSHTVGLGTLATQIRDSLPQHDQSVVTEIASVSDLGNILFNQSEDLRVNESQRVHLKVLIDSEIQVCKWSSTGQVPIYDKLYSDRNTPVLHISKADIDMDGGQHSCELILIVDDEDDSDEDDVLFIDEPILHTKKLTIPPVTLRVSCPQLDQFKESLASIYLAQPEVPQDSWPPITNRAYINLALIKQQKINYGEEYARLTIRGDMDDVLCHKEKIEYRNIFDGLRSGSLLLIEGRPGSGKTTFVHKITRDWAASEVQGPRRLVLLVSLIVLNSWEKPVTLEDILQLLNLQISPTVLQGRNGKGICFIFDGLDEFSPTEGKNSIVYKIINKKYLPQSIVIVASRPAALVKLRQRANKIIEVIGFPRDQIFEFVKNYPFSLTSKAEQLASYLLSHPNVLHMCYLPIHAAMVAFLFEIMGKVPRTDTEIYKHFTRFTLMRSLSKHKEQDELEDMDTSKLNEVERKLFDNICEFALEKTILKKQVLNQNFCLQNKDYRDISLGLVTVDRTAGLYGFKNIYTFLHLTHQEYLAAHHISTLSDEDQHKLIKQYGDKDHMQVVWKFYCGLVNFEGHEYKIKALINGRNKIILSDVQYAYESQQKVVCNCFMKKMGAQIILEDKYLTTTDFTTLGYLFANSSIPISLSLTNCNVNNEAVSALLKETEKKPLFICSFSYESHNVDLKSITKLLSQQHSLECLKMSHTSEASLPTTLDDHGFSDIVSTSLENLKQLSLSNVQIGPKTLSRVLELCKELVFLSLLNHDGEHLIKLLLDGVANCKNLERASLSTHVISSSVWCTIDINRTCDLTIPNFRADTNRLYIQGVRGHLLQTLRMNFESTDYQEDYSNLKSSCKYWPPRPRLFAIQTRFRHANVATMITEHVADFCTLERLILSMYITTDDAHVLASCLKHWPKLQELHLRGCGIEEEGASAIADNIKYCPELTKVDLSDNYISSKTSQMIKSSIVLHKEVSKSLHKEVPTPGSPHTQKSSHQEVSKSNQVSEPDKVGVSSSQLLNTVTDKTLHEETGSQQLHDEVITVFPHKGVPRFAITVLVISVMAGLLTAVVEIFT